MAVCDEGGTSSETLVTKIFYLSYERIALLTQHVAALRSCGRLPRKGFSSNRELLQSFSQLGPVWLRLARKKAPSARRNDVARSKGVLGHRAFAPRPEHEFWMTHISREGGDAAQSRWHQKDRKHQPERPDTKKHSISTSCDHMHSIHRPMHLSTW